VDRKASVPKWMVRATLVVLGVGTAAYAGWQGWGQCHFRAAEQSMARHQFADARAQLAECLRVWPSDGDTLLLAARAAERDGDTAEADRLLTAAEAGNPAGVTLERNLRRLRAGDLSDATRYFTTADTRRGEPDSKLILDGLIVGALKAGQFDYARRCLTLWDESHSDPWDRAQSKAWQGEIAYRTGLADVAVAHLREAFATLPGDDAIRLMLAEVLIQYAPAEAKGHLDALRAKRPDDRGVTIRLASCHRALGEPEEATRLLDDLLTRSERDVPALLERGRVALDLRRFDDAERWFRKAEGVVPQDREVYQALVRCLELAGKSAEAQAYRDKVR
jgi:tetratricopeptide (TPR) repeat protein